LRKTIYALLSSKFFILGTVIVLTILSVRTFFFVGIPIEWDHPFHLYQSWLMHSFFLPKGYLIGYDPYNSLGIVFLRYNLFYLVVAGLTYIIHDIVLTYKLTVVFFYCLFVISVYPIARQLGFDKRSSLLATLINLAPGEFENLWNGPFIGVFRIGLVTFYSAVGIGLITLAILIGALKCREKDYLKICLTGILLGFTSLMNPAVGTAFIILQTTIIIYYAIKQPGGSIQKVKDMIILTSIVLFWIFTTTACLLLPYLSYGGKYYSHHIERLHASNLEETLTQVFFFLFPYPIRLIAVASMIYILFKERKRFSLYLLLIFVTVLICSSPKLISSLIPSPTLSIKYIVERNLSNLPIYGKRQVALLRTFLTMSTAYLFCKIPEKMSNLVKGKTPDIFKLRKIVYYTCLGLAIFTCVTSIAVYTDLFYGVIYKDSIFVFSDECTYFKELVRVVEWMKENMTLNDRALVQDTWGILGSIDDGETYRLSIRRMDWPRYSHVMYLLPMMADKSIIGGWPDSNYITREFGVTRSHFLDDLINRVGIEAFTRKISDMGITYLTVHSSTCVEKLSESKNYQLITRYGAFYIFKCLTCKGIVSSTNSSSIFFTNLKPLYVRFNILSEYPNEVLIRLVYYESLKVKLDGIEVSPRIYYVDGIPFMKLKTSEGLHSIEIIYMPSLIDNVGRCLTFFSIACFAGIVIYKFISTAFRFSQVKARKSGHKQG